MPVKQTYKVSDLEKRLKLLNMQMYGNQPTNNNQQTTTNKQQPEDITYLKQDLIKIALTASLVIGVQFILYFSQLPSRFKLF
ncbi:hypothetical protein HYS92_03300 [Candidatus Daviesbacteria bacterium]|nr:hypothetical protein [Candidatus Daviesbacteria bacterium]